MANSETIGVLHPGAMGVSVAASAAQGGHEVLWASEGRSRETAERANEHGLADAGTLKSLCARCSILLSVCPPDAAESVAQAVLACSFQGLYADLNAISPDRARRIGAAMAAGGVEFVDGGIIGSPAWLAGETWLYLAGNSAERVAEVFSGGLLQAEVIGDSIGKASALKMCYAANTKGSAALLVASLGAAESLGVRELLEQQWTRDEPGSAEIAAQRASRVAVKAWRFAGEMDEIAATFGSAGMPTGFHEAAAETYRRLAEFKGAKPTLAEVLKALVSEDGRVA